LKELEKIILEQTGKNIENVNKSELFNLIKTITPLEKAKIFVSEFYLYSSVALLTLAAISTYPEAYNIFGEKLINYGFFMFNPIISLFSLILSGNMASFQELFLQIVFISLLLIFSKFNKKFQ
jgi:hypothetical protein